MEKVKKRKKTKTGLPPGSLIYTGDLEEAVDITVIDYDVTNYLEKNVKNIEEIFSLRDTSTVTWMNVIGLHRVDIIEKIGKHFGIHPLVLEDILNVNHRPKAEDFENYLFQVIKMISYDEPVKGIELEQVSLILGENFVFTFQEKKGDVFNAIRERIRNDKGRIRKMSTDYLTYAINDAVVDNYFVALENIDEEIEDIEDLVISNPNAEIVQSIYHLKRDLSILRKSVWPLREAISYIEKTESELITSETSVYFRDVYEHTIQVIDTIETQKDIVSGLLDIYLSSISNRMNEIMKVLTIIATIFIPLTFIAGVYGMNFKYMPELDWQLGYPVVVLLMVILAVIMLAYFRRKKWL